MCVWPFLVFPFVLVAVGIPYFYDFWPGLFLLYTNVLLGTVLTFGFFRWLSHRSHWVARFTHCLQGKADYVVGLRRVFKERTATLSALSMWGPLPIPLMVALVGLLTEADFLTFVVWSVLSSCAMITPVAIIAASASDIKDAFSSKNPGTISVTVLGVVLFVLLMVVLAYYTRVQLDSYSDEAEVTKFGTSAQATYLAMDSETKLDIIDDGGVTHSHHPAL
eukprot:TRINITY_DN3233_c0_g1_i1.p1 TRINITY_DN3233_c0_g1~~TRINITY_DN3233_c0_g1_i1.p1  ORF type:complete len:221 (-),score=26.07 TRINITY_DN3233_c0_g1_i1:139-801(-)